MDTVWLTADTVQQLQVAGVKNPKRTLTSCGWYCDCWTEGGWQSLLITSYQFLHLPLTWQVNKKCELFRRSPCSRPMRNRAVVMRARVWDPSWATRGVSAVIRAHVATETSRTRSPPTLTSQHHRVTSQNCQCPRSVPALLLTCHWRVPPGSEWSSSPRRIRPEPVQSRSCSTEKPRPLTRHRWARPSGHSTAGRCRGTASGSIYEPKVYEHQDGERVTYDLTVLYLL